MRVNSRPFVRSTAIGAAIVVLLFSAWAAGFALRPLGSDARLMMSWIEANTPSNTRVLVVSGSKAAIDSASEWFPVLASRASAATPQGHEWLSGDFMRLFTAHEELQACASGECLEKWSARTGIGFDAVLVVGTAGAPSCVKLAEDLETDGRYALLHVQGSTWVFDRLGRADAMSGTP